MNYPLQSLIQTGRHPAGHFPDRQSVLPFPTLSYTAPNGQSYAYLARRIVPQPGAPNYATVAQHTVKQGDRLDLLAATYLGDPLMYWLHLRRQRRDSSRRAGGNTRDCAQHHHASGRPRRGPVLLKSVQLSLMIGPLSR